MNEKGECKKAPPQDNSKIPTLRSYYIRRGITIGFIVFGVVAFVVLLLVGGFLLFFYIKKKRVQSKSFIKLKEPLSQETETQQI